MPRQQIFCNESVQMIDSSLKKCKQKCWNHQISIKARTKKQQMSVTLQNTETTFKVKYHPLKQNKILPLLSTSQIIFTINLGTSVSSCSHNFPIGQPKT